jgi:hypothetical protein
LEVLVSPLLFLGCVYMAGDVPYQGMFTLYGTDELVRETKLKLVGATLDVRFNRAHPDIENLYDSRFGGSSYDTKPSMARPSVRL